MGVADECLRVGLSIRQPPGLEGGPGGGSPTSGTTSGSTPTAHEVSGILLSPWRVGGG